MLFARSSHSIDRIDGDRPGRSIGRDKIPSLASELATRKATATPSRQSLRGLDWFIFFLADVQTGFGPFIAVYRTTQKWPQVEIGLVLSIGGLIGLIGQIPGGAIVDAARSERLVAGLAVATIGISALGYAAWPIFPVVVIAATLHAAASCVLGPAIAAISLGLVGPLAIGERLGRNARFASLGNGTAAAVMGTCGYLVSSRSVFLVSFILAIPTLLALARIREREIDAAQAHGAVVREVPDARATSVLNLMRQRPLLIFAFSVLLLQLANAAMLPLMAGWRPDPFEPVGAGIDRPMHHRATSYRRADVSVGRAQGAAMGATAATTSGFCGAGHSRRAIRDRARSVFAGRGTGVRWHHRGRLQRADTADCRRRRLRKRSLQSCAGYCRHSDRYRCIAQHRARRLRQRQVRQQCRFRRACGHCDSGPRRGLVCDAGNKAERGLIRQGLFWKPVRFERKHTRQLVRHPKIIQKWDTIFNDDSQGVHTHLRTCRSLRFQTV